MTDTRTLRLIVDPSQAKPQIRGIEKDLRRAEKATKALDRETSLLGSTYKKVGALVAGVAIGQATRGLVSTAARLEQLNSRLALSTDDVASAQDFLRRTTEETSAVYLDLADGYSKLLPLQKGGLITMEKLEKITLGLANASTALGVSQVDTNLALKGLTQILGKGNARTTAEDFNQTFDNLGAVLLEIERASGLASGGLRQLVLSTEGIAGTEIVDKLILGLEKFDGAAAALSGNITQSFNRIRTQYQLTANNLAAPIAAGVVPVADAISSALEDIAKNTDSYLEAAQLAAGATALAFGSRAIGEVSGFAVAQASAAKKIIKNELDKSKALKTAYTENAKIDAQRLVAQKAADQADADSAAKSAVLEKSRQAKIVSEKQAALATAQSTVATAENTLAQAANTTAVVESNLAITANARAQAQAAVLSSTSTAERLAASQSLNALQAEERALTASSVAAKETEIVAEKALTKAKADAGVASRALVQAEIEQAKASTEAARAQKAQTLAQQAATASRNTLNSATKNATAEETGLAAASTKVTIAMRAQAAATAAAGLAARGLNATMDLLGGPTGVILTAAVAAIYFATRQSEAEKAVEELDKALKGLNQRYLDNITSARSFAETQRKAAEAAVFAARENVSRLEDQFTKFANNPFGAVIALQLKQARDNLAELESGLIQFGKSSKDAFSAASTGKEFDDLFQTVVKIKEVVDSVGDSRQGLLDKIFPDEKKVRELEELQTQLNEIFKGNFDDSKYKEASKAIQQQIRDVDGTAEAEKKRADALKTSRNEVDQLTDEYSTQAELIKRKFETDAATIKFNIKTDAVPTGVLDQSGADALIARARAKRDADLQALRQQNLEKEKAANQALINEQLQQNQRTLALNASLRDQLQQAEQSNDPIAFQKKIFQEERTNLDSELQFRLINVTAYNARRLALTTDNAEKLAGLEQAASQQQLDDAVASGANRESAEEAHQNRLAEIARYGAEFRKIIADNQGDPSATYAAIESAYQEHQNRLNGISETGIKARLDIAAQLGTALLSLNENRRKIASSKALKAAQEDRNAANRAAREGTAEERAALEERAQQSEAVARKQFESEKKASLARARVAQALAIIQALSSTSNFYTNLALAGVAALKTQETINSIKSQQFNGGSSLTSSGSGGASGGSSSPSGSGGDVQTAGNTFIIMGDGVSQSDAIAAANDALPQIQAAAAQNQIVIQDNKITTSDTVFLRKRG